MDARSCEEVCSDTSENAGGIAKWEILDLLSALVDKSLVLAEEARGQTQYRLLETVRQYARDRLATLPDGEGASESVRRKHCKYYLAHAEAMVPLMDGPEQTLALDMQEAEHDNLRAAIEFAHDSTDSAEIEMRLTVALRWLWEVRGHLTEGRARYAAALSRPECLDPTKARADTLFSAALLARMQSDYPTGRAYQEESLAIRRRLGDSRGICFSLNSLGLILFDQGQREEARKYLEESLTIAREMGDKGRIAHTLNNLGMVLDELGDDEGSRRCYGECISVARETGFKRALLMGLTNMGIKLFVDRDLEGAQAYLDQAATVCDEIGERFSRGHVLIAFALEDPPDRS